MIDNQNIKENCSLLNKTRILIFSLETLIQPLFFNNRLPQEMLFSIFAIIKTIDECIYEHMKNLYIPENAILQHKQFIEFLEKRKEYESNIDFKNMTIEEYEKYVKNSYARYEDFVNGFSENYLQSTEKAKTEIDMLKKLYGEFTL